jgi:predicted GTPase
VLLLLLLLLLLLPLPLLLLALPGRDYHLFNTRYRNDPSVEVVGFTHAQVCLTMSVYTSALLQYCGGNILMLQDSANSF